MSGVPIETVDELPAWTTRPLTLTFRQRKKTVAAQLLYAYKAQMIKRILDGGHGRVALSDTLAGQTTSDGRLIVDSATLFLSHAWMMETGEFLDVTIANMGEEDYAWIDIFVYPQFSEGDGSTGAWIKRFDNMIVGIGKVVSAARLFGACSPDLAMRCVDIAGSCDEPLAQADPAGAHLVPVRARLRDGAPHSPSCLSSSDINPIRFSDRTRRSCSSCSRRRSARA